MDETTVHPYDDTHKKPRYRGVSHEITFYLGVVGAIALIATAPAGLPTVAATVYALSFVTLFGASALYHRPTWSPERRLVLQRIDHSAIFVLIAGTYTPIALLAVPPDIGHRLLWIVWSGAALGVLKSVFWTDAPKPLLAGLCVLLGWAMVAEWSAVVAGLGEVGAALIIVGGALYTVGAVVYALQWPDPLPRTFGYHEVFHILVIAAALCHATLVVGLTASWVPPGAV